jgi:glycogen debranching enzyme
VTGDELVAMGLDGLESLVREHGVDASDAASGLYPALYGRDSLWVLLLLEHAAALHADPRIGDLVERLGPRILRSLAALQGNEVNDLVEEQPGRIPHEHHPVPSAHAVDTELPLADGRSYAGFDETFLFVLANDAFVATRPGHALVSELRPNVERALAWIDQYADSDGDGLFEYPRRNPANLLNQVWKDSFDSATHTGFDVPPQPVAWLEVQAYAYAIFGTPVPGGAAGGRAPRDGARADRIAALVDERFWLGPDDAFAMAVDGDKRPIRMVASNPGHALWAGVVRPDRVAPLIDRMTRPDLLSPYGLRSLSRRSPFYAPFAYHRGAVWPFDNAVFALGLLRHGRADLAAQVARAVGLAMAAAGTPVECYAVLEADDFVDGGAGKPALCWRHWPVRNRVQAFTAAGLVAMGALLVGGEG